MTIGIDARLYGQGLGLGRYVAKLIEHLERIDDDTAYVIFMRTEALKTYHPHSTRFRTVCADIPWYSWSEQFILPWIFLKERCDLIHVPHFNIPILYPGKILVTIHDVILLKNSQSATSAASTRSPFIHWVKYQAYRCVFRSALARACRIITVSQAVARDLRARAPWAGAKITVIYEAADVLPSVEFPEAEGGSPAPAPFFFNAGNAYPHKNIDALLTAMSIVHDVYPSVTLALCGQEDYFQKALVARIRQRGWSSFITHYGCVSDSQLRWFYEHAVAIVLPSLEEGFGLQIIEAFLHSCPVVASAIPVYEEIAGDAAVYVDMTQANLLADALMGLIRDTAARSAMIEKGKKRAMRFSWDATAHQTLAQYYRALK